MARVTAPPPEPPAEPSLGTLLLRPFRGPGLGARIALYEELRSLHSAGFDWSRALRNVEERRTGAARDAVGALRAAVEHGATLADGMRARPATFSALEIALVEAGERTGRLEDLLAALVRELETRRETRNRVFAAAAYPLFLVHFAILVPVGVMGAVFGPGYLVVVLPSLAVLWGLGVGGYLLHAALRGSPGYARVLLSIPVLGEVLRLRAVARFCGAFGAVHGAGADHHEALRLATAACGNAALQGELQRADSVLREGGELAAALRSTGARLPAEVHQLVESGEASGDLERSFERLAALLGERADARTKPLLSLLPALFLVPVAVVVLLVALSALSSYLAPLRSL